MNTPSRAYHDPLDRLYHAGLGLGCWQAGCLCLLAGLACNLGFAPIYLWPIHALALISLIWMLDGAARFRRPMYIRWVYASLFAAGLIGGGWSWLIADLIRVVDRQIIALHAGFLATQAVGWGMIIAVFSLVWRPGPARVGIFCIAVCAAEWLRAVWNQGVVWNPAALVWPPGNAVSQVASVIGVNGLSALTVLLFAAPMATIDQRAGGLALRVFPLVVVGACLGLLWGWGAARLDSATRQTSGTDDQITYTLRLIDVSDAQSDDILRHYLAATSQNSDTTSATEIVIWPQSATKHLLFQSTRYIDPIAQVLGDKVLIAGSMRSEPAGTLDQQMLYYNSLAVLTANSVRRGPLATHDVSRLLPFGIDSSLRGRPIVTGLSPIPIRLEGIPAFMPMIGAESLISWRPANPGDRPAWIVHLTNEQDRISLFSRQQSFAHAQYRSIESGLPMARVSAGGISGVIDRWGRSVAVTAFEGGSELEDSFDSSPGNIQRFILPDAAEKTPFSIGWGRYFPLLFVLFNLSLFALIRN